MNYDINGRGDVFNDCGRALLATRVMPVVSPDVLSCVHSWNREESEMIRMCVDAFLMMDEYLKMWSLWWE